MGSGASVPLGPWEVARPLFGVLHLALTPSFFELVAFLLLKVLFKLSFITVPEWLFCCRAHSHGGTYSVVSVPLECSNKVSRIEWFKAMEIYRPLALGSRHPE